MEQHGLKITRLTSAHSDVMSALHQSGFASGWSREAIETLLGSAHCVGLGAFDPGTPDPGAFDPEFFGFLLLGLVADEAEIMTLVVAPKHRRRGIARALLEQAIITAKASGAASLFLEVSTENAAATALYTTFGFEETGRRPGYYQSENGADAVVMVLRF